MKQRAGVVLFFLDGVGLGRKDPRVNPFFRARLPFLRRFLGKGGEMPSLRSGKREHLRWSLVPLNATLGMPGLPQSGTGQTALLTGVNAPRVAGRHFGPYPPTAVRRILDEQSLFPALARIKRRILYANAFPHQYFEYLSARKGRTPAITSSWIAAGRTPLNAESLGRKSSLSADMTNERWHRLGYPHLPVISPEEAGRRLAGFSRENDFVLYEYFITDHVGHSQSMDEAVTVLERIDRFLEGFFCAFDLSSGLFLLTSDHGNLEDLSVKTHTRNPVPLLAAGQNHKKVTASARDLTHVAPAIVSLLSS